MDSNLSIQMMHYIQLAKDAGTNLLLCFTMHNINPTTEEVDAVLIHRQLKPGTFCKWNLCYIVVTV